MTDADDALRKGTIDTDAPTPRTPSPPITCPHHPAARQNRYSTSSLPASNEWITYTGTPAAPRKRRPHTADEVVESGGRFLRLEKQRSNNIQPIEVRDAHDEVIGSLEEGEEKDNDAEASLASSGILAATMAVSMVPNPASVACAPTDPVNESLHLGVADTLVPRALLRPKVSAPPCKIAVIGLNNSTARQWEHRLLVFLLFPSAQPRLCSSPSSCGEGQGGRPFVACIRTEEGTSLATEIPIVRSLFPNEEERQALVQSGGELGMFESDGEMKEAVGSGEPGWRDSSTASSARSKQTSDSGYVSAFGEPWIEASDAPPTLPRAGLALDGVVACRFARLGERKPERGVKRCVQLDFRGEIDYVGGSGVGQNGGLGGLVFVFSFKDSLLKATSCR